MAICSRSQEQRHGLISLKKRLEKSPSFTGAQLLKGLHLDESFTRYPLWLAHYGVLTTLTPAPWKQWTMWQFTDSGSVPGLASGHHVDSNYFNGSIEQLKAFVS
ncbi:lysozyme [Azospirillaceae bacterium]